MKSNDLSLNNVNLFAGELIILELIRCGVKSFFISPGSRSTPLVMAVSRFEKSHDLELVIVPDERSAAYMSLGYNKSGKLSALICTSGTAVANYFPAVIEASEGQTPLIIISADRPLELRKTQANQTIDQVKLFGNQYSDYIEIDCGDRFLLPENILTNIDNAINNLRLPLQINCCFREPFLANMPFEGKLSNKFNRYLADPMPYTKNFIVNTNSVDFSLLPTVSGKIMFILGNTNNLAFNKRVAEFAEEHNIPLIVDIQSGVQLFSSKAIINFSDYILCDENNEIMPDLIIQIGNRITSKITEKFIQKSIEYNNARYVLVSDDTRRQDPSHSLDVKITLDYRSVEASIHTWNFNSNPEFLKMLSEKSAEITEKYFKMISAYSFEEHSSIQQINKLIPKGSILFLGNSLSIRNFDAFSANPKHLDNNTDKVLDVRANRGTSGIDGVLSSAIGYAVARKEQTTLVIGDLSLYYELNALIHLSKIKSGFIVVVFNNNGGGIFRQLPVGSTKEYERFFQTPLNINFKLAAEMFDIEYVAPKTMQYFETSYNKAIEEKNNTIIEIFVDSEESYLNREKIKEYLKI